MDKMNGGSLPSRNCLSKQNDLFRPFILIKQKIVIKVREEINSKLWLKLEKY